MLDEVIAFIFLFIIVLVFICFVCNQSFWQGYRNTKFLDELFEEHKKKNKKELRK